MTHERYAKLVYDLADKPTRRGEFIELDLSRDEHFQCVAEIFGGEDNLKTRFTHANALIQNSRRAPKTDGLKDGTPVGLTDVAEIYEAFIDNANALQVPGLVVLTEAVPQMYIMMTVFKNGVQIGFKNNFVYGVQSGTVAVTRSDFEPSLGDEIKTVLHATWQPAGSDKIRSVISTDINAADSFIISEVVQQINVTDPVIKEHPIPPTHTTINVMYNRASDITTDYSYPENRDPQKNQKLFLEGRGEVVLTSGAVFHSALPNRCSLWLVNPEKGGLRYNSDNQDAWLSPSSSCTSFKWNIPEDWSNSINESVAASSRLYSYALNLHFNVSVNGGDPTEHEISVCSNDDDDPRPSYKVIPGLRLQWGCFAEGTLIRMADGTCKAIQDITIGETVKTANGQTAQVKDVFSGPERQILTIETISGALIKVSDEHPLLTASGVKRAAELRENDRLVMEGGEEDEIKYRYYSDYAGKVYNILLAGENHIIYAGGFTAGDMELQNQGKLKAVVQTDSKVITEINNLREFWAQ
jgi:hypothetical protein